MRTRPSQGHVELPPRPLTFTQPNPVSRGQIPRDRPGTKWPSSKLTYRRPASTSSRCTAATLPRQYASRRRSSLSTMNCARRNSATSPVTRARSSQRHIVRSEIPRLCAASRTCAVLNSPAASGTRSPHSGLTQQPSRLCRHAGLRRHRAGTSFGEGFTAATLEADLTSREPTAAIRRLPAAARYRTDTS